MTNDDDKATAKCCANCANWVFLSGVMGECRAPLPEWLDTTPFREPIMMDASGQFCDAFVPNKE